MPDLESLSPDQRLALKTAAKNLTGEYKGTFSIETIQLFLETSYEQFAGRASVATFLPLLAERFARQRLEALAKVEGKADEGIPIVLFLCVHNAGRSQMAAAFFNQLADPARATATSAGTEPGSEVHPEVVAVMREAGIDLSEVQPRYLTDELARSADLLVTMGCGDACPFVPGLEVRDWPLDDPKGLPLDEVRRIRDEVKARVVALIEEIG